MTDQTIARPIPRVVRHFETELRSAGLEPVCERRRERLWRVSATTPQTEVYVDLKRTIAGRWQWADSKLTVNGKPHPLAGSAQQLAQIVKRASGERVTATADPMPPPAHPSLAPPSVQAHYYALTRQLHGEVPVLLGRNGNVWVIGIDMDKGALRMYFARFKPGMWPMRRLQVILDQEDRSCEVGTDLARALLLMSDSGDRPQAAATLGSVARAPGPDASRMRKGTVMRN